MSEYTRPIKALGEVVLRVRALEAMQEFYEKVIGLELLGEYENTIVLLSRLPQSTVCHLMRLPGRVQRY
jgi:catechol-2,3-dioxygenase